MVIRKAIIGLAPFAFLASAFAYEPLHIGNLPPEWQACKISADCGVESGPCGGSIGANIHHQAQVHAEMCKALDCSVTACDASAIRAWAAVCKDGKCVPDYSAPMPAPSPPLPNHYTLGGLSFSEPYCKDKQSKSCGGGWITHYDPKWTMCETTSDCTLVSTKCGPVTGANIHYQHEVITENDKKEPHPKSCNAPRAPAVPVCQNGGCVVPDFNPLK